MYNNTSKLLISQFCTDFTEWLIGEPIKLSEMQPTELYYEPIKADSVVLLENDNPHLSLGIPNKPFPHLHQTVPR
jgi:predicted transposase YdaD